MESLYNSDQKLLCVAVDYRDKQNVVDTIELLGKNGIKVFKIHCDIINNFDDTFIETLKELKTRLNIVLWEDRKFSDIGFITEQQLHYGVHKISSWADIVTFHSTCGSGSIPLLKGIDIFLVIELSVDNHLCDENYIKKSIDIANTHPNIKGVVCQHLPEDLNPKILKIVPGISLSGNTSDHQNQRYNTTGDKSFADIFVVGRTVTNSPDPIKTIKEIQRNI